MRYYHKFSQFSNKLGKICFPSVKIEFWTHWEFFSSSRIFVLKWSPEYLYRLSDVLPKHTTYEKETPSITGLHLAIISWWVGG